jgi:hypothetical protein
MSNIVRRKACGSRLKNLLQNLAATEPKASRREAPTENGPTVSSGSGLRNHGEHDRSGYHIIGLVPHLRRFVFRFRFSRPYGRAYSSTGPSALQAVQIAESQGLRQALKPQRACWRDNLVLTRNLTELFFVDNQQTPGL